MNCKYWKKPYIPMAKAKGITAQVDKKAVLNTLGYAYQEAMDRSNTAISIANKYGIPKTQVESWRNRNAGYQIPNNFPTLTEFLNNHIVHYKLR